MNLYKFGMFEVRFVFQGRFTRRQGLSVDAIRVEAELQRHEIGRERARPQGEGQPDPGELARLREGPDHQQVVVLVQQGRGGLRPEVDVGLVDDRQAVPVLFQQPPDVGERQGQPGRRVGVGRKDRLPELNRNGPACGYIPAVFLVLFVEAALFLIYLRICEQQSVIKTVCNKVEFEPVPQPP